MSSSEIDLSEFYSPLGTALIESIYFDDYLSIGGTGSTDILAAEAGITAASNVLDVGSGLGGPALHLAQNHGCRVTGLDIVESNVQTANERAAARGLDQLANFRLGDAMAMPFEAGQFDVIVGQDAWCHVPDKDKLIAECARVITPGGMVAFTDWLAVGEMDGADRDEVLAAMAAPNLATLASHAANLDRHGFTVLKQDDISAVFISQYNDIIARLESMEGEISETFSAKLYSIIHN
ncbi:MAG: methyltransferase domain-containing protein, partial [Rhodospirillaceae bacterium]|nr:methyltransferase domain-containing protein [Rhodospirillaceae bacterium]